MTWIAIGIGAWFVFNTLFAAALYFRSRRIRRPRDYSADIIALHKKPTFNIDEDNVDQSWGR